MSNETAIEIADVSKRFRLIHERNSTLKATIFRGLKRTVHEDLWALEDVSFAVPKGTTFGIVGHNGSGKSTLLKCMARIYRPDTGSIQIDGRMSALLELGAGFHPELSGRENVYLNGSILGLSTRQVNDRFDDIVAFSGLERFIDSPVKNYSSGMFVRLGFAVAINVEPEVLLVDEVLAVGDESFQQKCLERFADLRREGNTIVVVTHSLETVRNLCDLAVWLDHGHLLHDGPAGEVADAYLDSVQEARRAEQPGSAVPLAADAVSEVELLDATGATTEAVELFGELTIATTRRPEVEVHRLRVDLYRTDGIHVGGTEVTVEPGDPLTLGYHLPKVLLSPATYDVSVHAYDRAGSCVADLSRVRRFDVTSVPNDETHGLMAMGGAGPPLPEGVAARSMTQAEGLAIGATAWVALIGTASLALAQLGAHNGVLALAIATVVGLGLVVMARREALRLERSPRDLALVALLAILSLVMFLPGFPYAYADKDPGIYVIHALSIAREGDVRLDDPVLEANLPGVLWAPGARFPGVWTDGATDSVTPQFFHFFPALAATAVDLTDERAAFHLNALLAALSVVVVALGVRRGFGLPAAAIAGGLLAISLPQVWQAKYPSTEILAQLLLAGAVLAAAVAADRRSPTVALVGGALVGIGLLARPDGLLLVLLCVGAGGVLLAIDRFDRTARWFAGGLALTVPYALFNAYHLRHGYTLSNDVPDLPIVVATSVAILLLGRAVRPLAIGVPDWLSSAQVQRRIGTALAVGFAVLLLVLATRERFFGEAYTTLLGPEPRRSYDEINLRRLTFYLSRLVPPLAVVGLAIVGRQRWRTARWVLLVPGLCMAPLYLWEAQISPRLMWWVRRFVPGVVPVLLVLTAIALAWGLTQRRWLLRGLASIVLVVLVVGYLQRSLPIRDHREMAGSFQAAEAVAAVAGEDQGLFLWQRPPANDIFAPTRNVPAVVWLGFDQLSALLPDDPSQAAVDEYAARFPERPVYVVSDDGELPGSLDPADYTKVAHVDRVLPVWEEAVLTRPQHSTSIGIDLTIWQLDDERADRGS